MNHQTAKIGDRVEKFCPACEKQLGHVARSINAKGIISRVECAKCGRTSIFRPSAKLEDMGSALKTVAPYDRTVKYRAGESMNHSKFGIGDVMTVVSAGTIDVLFPDQLRRLIHGR